MQYSVSPQINYEGRCFSLCKILTDNSGEMFFNTNKKYEEIPSLQEKTPLEAEQNIPCASLEVVFMGEVNSLKITILLIIYIRCVLMGLTRR